MRDNSPCDDEIAPPIIPRMRHSDATQEGIFTHYETGTPSIGIVTDEAAIVFGGYSMRPENQVRLFGFFAQLWGGKQIDRTRASKPSLTLYGRRLSMHLMAQPRTARAFLLNTALRDQGLGARLLIAWPETTQGTRFICDSPEEQQRRKAAEQTLRRFEERHATCLEAPLPTSPSDPLELRPRLLTLSPGAYIVVVEFYNALEAELAEGRFLAKFSDYVSKLPEQACRLAALLTLGADFDAEEISETAMCKALKLAEWYLHETIRVQGHADIDGDLLLAEELRTWLVDKFRGDIVNRRLIVNRGPGHLRDTALIRKLTGILEDNRWLIRAKEDTLVEGRKSRESWYINRP